MFQIYVVILAMIARLTYNDSFDMSDNLSGVGSHLFLSLYTLKALPQMKREMKTQEKKERKKCKDI